MPSLNWAAENPDTLQSAPFDGVMLTAPFSARVFSEHSLSDDEIAAAFSAYGRSALSRTRRDFLLVFASHPRADQKPPVVFDDWTVVLDNLHRIAVAARKAGLQGIAFDNEPYGANWFGWSEVMAERAPFEKWEELYRRRGSACMTAIQSAWPKADLLVFLGAWVSVDAYGRYKPPLPFIGPFFAGMEEAKTSASLIDGGEIYRLQSPEDFFRTKHGLLYLDPLRFPFLTRDQRERWHWRIEIAFGVYDRRLASPPDNPPLAAETLVAHLSAALRATDRYVWLYSEAYDWWGGHPTLPRVPGAYPFALHELLREIRQPGKRPPTVFASSKRNAP